MKKNKIKTFNEETKQAVAEAQNHFCKAINCYCRIHSIHHKLPNNKVNRKKFPLFIHSVLNAVGLCSKHHSDYAHLFKITEKEAIIYEEFLQKLLENVFDEGVENG